MEYLDLTLPTPAENIALDEALLEEAESAGEPTETLRLWEPLGPMVVLGRSSRIEAEVRLDACRALNIPVLRRSSGGASIVTGPGCLMYALVLSCRMRPTLRNPSEAHRFVLDAMTAAIAPLVVSGEPNASLGADLHATSAVPSAMPAVHRRGTSDLALGELKFSGNSVRRRRDHLLYHGTVLYDFPLGMIGQCLRMPPRVPDYRAGRPHDGFVTNLPGGVEAIRRALLNAWAADRPREHWPEALTARLTAEKYARPEWNGFNPHPGGETKR